MQRFRHAAAGRLYTLLLTLVMGSLALSTGSMAAGFLPLEQGWSDEQRQRFWSLGQGAEIIPYSWFLVLEQADSKEKFNSADNISRLGYIPWPEHPDSLPIGFTRAANPHTGREWLGINCSACHTNTIEYGGKTLLIDGAPTLADYWQFNVDLVNALTSTLEDDAKFQRFAAALEKKSGGADALRNDLAEVAAARAAYNTRNRHTIEYGHGRLDALGFIFNEVTVGLLKASDGKSPIPENRRSPEAPVSYPFLWATSQADYVQWNGVSFAQMPIGNLARDVVEVLGVYGKVDLDCEGGFKSSLLFRNSRELADMVISLKSPEWPNNILPPIDVEEASRGEALYRDYCVECHEVIPRSQSNRRYQSGLWPMSIIGTDALYARNATQWVSSGCLAGESIMPGGSEKLAPTDMSYSIASHVALKVMAQEPGQAILPVLGTRGVKENLKLNGLELRKPGAYYKARPLNGIWATAPYLHNGSVPTLEDLLLPPEDRPKKFSVGCHGFDPDKVGFVKDCKHSSEFQVDYSKAIPCSYEVLDEGERRPDGEWVHYPYRDPRLPGTDGDVHDPKVRDNGNCNVGHDIRKYDGSAFSDEERSALVEYLKTL